MALTALKGIKTKKRKPVRRAKSTNSEVTWTEEDLKDILSMLQIDVRIYGKARCLAPTRS